MSGMLTAVLSHQDPETVEAHLAALDAFASGERFVVAYGGAEQHAARLPADRSVFIADPTLRGSLHDQQYTEILVRVFERFVRDDPSVTHVFIPEYDHLILRRDFSASLVEVVERTGAGFLGYNAVERSGTNWMHYLRLRDDPAFLAFLRSISVREDPAAIYGALGDGMLMTRAALEDFCAIEAHHPAYVEVYIATVMHHLGHRVADLSGESDLYRWVRSNPPWEERDLRAALAEGATFIHPFKDPVRGTAIAAAHP